jgi:hypothetical protein
MVYIYIYTYIYTCNVYLVDFLIRYIVKLHKMNNIKITYSLKKKITLNKQHFVYNK